MVLLLFDRDLQLINRRIKPPGESKREQQRKRGNYILPQSGNLWHPFLDDLCGVLMSLMFVG